jgi:hypothetical protein
MEGYPLREKEKVVTIWLNEEVEKYLFNFLAPFNETGSKQIVSSSGLMKTTNAYLTC